MTEQEKTSAVVEETREAVDTTSQPVATEKKSKNNTALILSAVAIAIALAAGVGLYGWGKQQAVNQTATSDALANQLTALFFSFGIIIFSTIAATAAGTIPEPPKISWI